MYNFDSNQIQILYLQLILKRVIYAQLKDINTAHKTNTC